MSSPARPSPARRLLLAAVAMAFGLGLPLLMMEGALRLLPVNSGLAAVDVDAGQPVFRFAPGRSFVWSAGWAMAGANEGRVNAAGFVNDQDYDASAADPLLAVIGDSYIEALMVPYGETLHGRLAAAVDGKGRVYSFAASGAPLSQYLAWAAHARDAYRPRGMVFAVVGNDFDESLAAYKTSPGFHHYVRDDDALRLQLFPFQRGLTKRLATESALLRYLVMNLKVTALTAGPDGTFVGNTAAEATPPRLADSQAAVEAFFRDLPAMSGLPPERIAFVVDALRDAIYQTSAPADAEASYFGQMRRHFIERARTRGYEVIDMQTVMTEAFRRDGQRFDFPYDGHWNGVGHAVAAEAVKGSRTFRAVFE